MLSWFCPMAGKQAELINVEIIHHADTKQCLQFNNF
jgi:hypothetical protein